MYEALWLLLPAAAASGWFAALKSVRTKPKRTAVPSLRSDYFKGLNYLINEQPDKAIEVFVRMLEVDAETVETHLALGNLFRRRGEVDRAIRIHQNVMAQSGLRQEVREQALLELGQDYMRAGLLDRAEGLFQELVESKPHRDRALRELTRIYQQEKDWEKAVEAARRLGNATGKAWGRVISHYHCEQAEAVQRGGGSGETALKLVRQGLDESSQCVRASLMEGRLLENAEDYRAAVRAYMRVEQQDPDYLPEIIEPLTRCYDRLGRPDDMEEYLSYLLERYGGITPTLALADMKLQREGEAAAIEFLTEQLRRRPSVRGLDRLIAMSLVHLDGPARENMLILKDLTDKLLDNRAVYKCGHCGFTGKSLHWQCPSCKYWGTIKPIQGVEGE